MAKADSAAKVAYKKLDLSFDKPVVGAEVRVAAADLPAAAFGASGFGAASALGAAFLASL